MPKLLKKRLIYAEKQPKAETVFCFHLPVQAGICSKAMNREDIAVILMTEHLVSLCPDLVYDLKLNHKRPLIVEIPDRHGSRDIADSINNLVHEAIGLKL